MARPSKFNANLVQQLEALLGAGNTIEDACAVVGITRQTLHNWKTESARLRALADETGTCLITLDQVGILTFLDVLTRAQARATVMAVMAVRSGLVPSTQVDTTTEKITETRFRKNKETGKEEAYLYTYENVRTVVREIPPDPRIGIEYLKRRKPEEWGDRATIRHEWEDKTIAAIRAGQIAFEDLAEEFDDGFATEFFARAGVPVSVGEG